MKKLSLELQNALDKELNLMKNDFYYQQLEIQRDGGLELVRMDAVFEPLDVLGGDSYSLRKTEDGKVIFFIIDAMGKGISASITAATTTSLLNYIFDQMNRQGDFEFERWIKRYIDFVKNEILDNEMVAIYFGIYDKYNSTFKHASFGMPSALIFTHNNELIKIKSNNAPISQYTQGFKIDIVDVRGIKKALFYTDGLCENILENGKFYKDKMYQDFINSENIVDFSKKVKNSIITKDDDILYFYIDTLKYNCEFIIKAVNPDLGDINDLIYEISQYIKKNGAQPKEMSELSLALSELMMNSLEHGVFGIDRSTKNRLIENGKYDALLKEMQIKFKERKIEVSYAIKQEGGSKILIAIIKDGGDGFDTRTLRKLETNPQNFNGRGIMIIKKLLDRFYYNEKGNTITIRKFLN